MPSVGRKAKGGGSIADGVVHQVLDLACSSLDWSAAAACLAHSGGSVPPLRCSLPDNLLSAVSSAHPPRDHHTQPTPPSLKEGDEVPMSEHTSQPLSPPSPTPPGPVSQPQTLSAFYRGKLVRCARRLEGSQGVKKLAQHFKNPLAEPHPRVVSLMKVLQVALLKKTDLEGILDTLTSTTSKDSLPGLLQLYPYESLPEKRINELRRLTVGSPEFRRQTPRVLEEILPSALPAYEWLQWMVEACDSLKDPEGSVVDFHSKILSPGEIDDYRKNRFPQEEGDPDKKGDDANAAGEDILEGCLRDQVCLTDDWVKFSRKGATLRALGSFSSNFLDFHQKKDQIAPKPAPLLQEQGDLSSADDEKIDSSLNSTLPPPQPHSTSPPPASDQVWYVVMQQALCHAFGDLQVDEAESKKKKGGEAGGAKKKAKQPSKEGLPKGVVETADHPARLTSVPIQLQKVKTIAELRFIAEKVRIADSKPQDPSRPLNASFTLDTLFRRTSVSQKPLLTAALFILTHAPWCQSEDARSQLRAILTSACERAMWCASANGQGLWLILFAARDSSAVVASSAELLLRGGGRRTSGCCLPRQSLPLMTSPFAPLPALQLLIEEKKRHLNGMLMAYIDEHKMKAVNNAILQPAKYAYECEGRYELAEYAETHGLNFYLVVIQWFFQSFKVLSDDEKEDEIGTRHVDDGEDTATAKRAVNKKSGSKKRKTSSAKILAHEKNTLQVPYEVLRSDPYGVGVAFFWDALNEVALKAFTDPSNFGRGIASIPDLNNKEGFGTTAIRKKLEKKSRSSAFKMTHLKEVNGYGRTPANLEGSLNTKPFTRPQWKKMADVMVHFFKKEFLVKKLWETLQSESEVTYEGFLKTASIVFAEFHDQCLLSTTPPSPAPFPGISDMPATTTTSTTTTTTTTCSGDGPVTTDPTRRRRLMPYVQMIATKETTTVIHPATTLGSTDSVSSSCSRPQEALCDALVSYIYEGDDYFINLNQENTERFLMWLGVLKC